MKSMKAMLSGIYPNTDVDAFPIDHMSPDVVSLTITLELTTYPYAIRYCKFRYHASIDTIPIYH